MYLTQRINELRQLFFKVSGIILISWVIGFISLFVVFQIDTAKINTNIQKSISVFSKEGTYPKCGNIFRCILDNFTDSIMLMTAGYENNDKSLMEKTLKVFHYIGTENGKILESPCDVLIRKFSTNQNNLSFKEQSYARYWHGYLLFLKPLLKFTHYGNIRIILTITHVLLILSICFYLFKIKLTSVIFPYLFSIASINFLALCKSLQFSSVFIITNFSLLFLLYFRDKFSKSCLITYFLLLGILTSFFDLLTCPILTLCFPLSFYFILKNNDPIKLLWINSAYFIIAWFFGYVGMWLGKWIIASLLTDENVIMNAYHAFLFRSSSEYNGIKFNGFDVLLLNLKNYCNGIEWIFIAVFIFFSISNYLNFFKKLFKFSPIFLIIFIWYVIVANHSFVHPWMTFRNLSVLFFIILYCAIVNFSFSKIKFLFLKIIGYLSFCYKLLTKYFHFYMKNGNAQH